MLDIDPSKQSPKTKPTTSQTWNAAPGPTPQTTPKERKTKSRIGGTVFFVGVLALFIILMGAGVWGLVYYKNQQISKTESEISIQDAQLNKLKNVEQEVLALQAQYKNVESVLAKRQIWGQLIDVLSQETLKRAVFSNLSAEDTSQNTMTLSGTTDSLTSLAKLMVAFQNSENFTNFQLSSMGLPSKDNPNVSFSIELKFKKNIIIPTTNQ